MVNKAGGLFTRKTIEEVADLVAYIESDDTSIITRNNIDINGGLAFSEFLFFKD